MDKRWGLVFLLLLAGCQKTEEEKRSERLDAEIAAADVEAKALQAQMHRFDYRLSQKAPSHELFHIKAGEPLSLPVCARSTHDGDDVERTCVSRGGFVFLQPDQKPTSLKNSYVAIDKDKSGNVNYIGGDFDVDAADDVKAALKEKFGETDETYPDVLEWVYADYAARLIRTTYGVNVMLESRERRDAREQELAKDAEAEKKKI